MIPTLNEQQQEQVIQVEKNLIRYFRKQLSLNGYSLTGNKRFMRDYHNLKYIAKRNKSYSLELDISVLGVLKSYLDIPATIFVKSYIGNVENRAMYRLKGITNDLETRGKTMIDEAVKKWCREIDYKEDIRDF